MRTSWTRIALAVGCAGWLAGCGSAVKLNQTPVETATPKPAAQSQAPATPATPAAQPQSQVATVNLNREGATVPASLGRSVYFDFDSYVIKDEYRPLIDAYAKALSADKTHHVVLEGNTDERGSREYNLALGQRRAEAVLKSLELLGVNANQLEAVSFGKERPVALGHDEQAWAKNRRVDFKDK